MVCKFNHRIHLIFSDIELIEDIHFRTEEPISLLKMANEREFTIRWNLFLGQLVFEPILRKKTCVDGKEVDILGFLHPKKMVTPWSQMDSGIADFFRNRFFPYFDYMMDQAEDLIEVTTKSLMWKKEALESIAQLTCGLMDGDVVKWPSQFKDRVNAALVDDPNSQVVRLILDVDLTKALKILLALKLAAKKS
jgi:hypothetical protein